MWDVLAIVVGLIAMWAIPKPSKEEVEKLRRELKKIPSLLRKK